MDIKFNPLWAVIFGIFGFIIGKLLFATEIFSVIPNLEYIGLFLGFIYGGFKDTFGINFGKK